MKKHTIVISTILLFFAVCAGAQDKYTPDWESLSQFNEAPDWFKDAKFGIYTHWGPQSLGNLGMENGVGWYGHALYMAEGEYDWQTGEMRLDKNGNPRVSETTVHHTKTYGDINEVGYKDLIKLFKPDKFDAEEWADLFQKSGAKFAGPVAMHHDNYAMWDSDVTRWNVKDMAGIDVTGDLKKAIEKRDMKFLASFHHAFTWVYYANASKYDGKDPQWSDLYTDAHEITDFKTTKRFKDEWWAKLKEAIDKYEPDVLWFDWWVQELEEEYRKKFLAYYFNKGEEWGKEVCVAYKNESFPSSTGILDFERGRSDKITSKVWLTDTSTGPWFYRDNPDKKTANELIDILVDIVSKNGCMLLNVPPNPDGSLPDYVKETLLGMGAWMDINGEAIYGTRPWIMFGEGPSKLARGGHKMEENDVEYMSEDIRYVTKGNDVLYALCLGAPEKDILMKALSTDLKLMVDEITSVELVGSDEEIKWNQDSDGLHISKSKKYPNDIAVAFKINLNVTGGDVYEGF